MATIDERVDEAELGPTRTSRQYFNIEKDDESDAENSNLPYAADRNTKWWYSAYHNITALIGAGVLGFPTSMVFLGWEGGAVVLAMFWVITLFTLWQMVQLHEDPDWPGERMDTYYQLGQKVFGKKLGLWIVLPQQIIKQMGVCIVYNIVGGMSLWQFYRLMHCPHFNPAALNAGDQCCGKLGEATFTVIFALCQLVFAQLHDFNSIASLSLLASVTSIGYCTIAWVDSLHLGKSNHSGFGDPTKAVPVCPTSYHISHNTNHPFYTTKMDNVFGVFSALGNVAFAFSGHNVVLEIQATLRSTREEPSKVRMWRGVMVSYIVVALCYFPVAFACYWAFGTDVAFRGTSPGNPRGANILLQLDKPRGLIATANLFVAIHLTGGYQVYAMPIYELMEKILEKKFKLDPIQLGCTSLKRIVTRSVYVLITAFVALTLPFFSDLLGFIGGFAIPCSFFIPCIIWLKKKKPPLFSITWLINWVLIISGALLAIFVMIGGLRNIIVDASSVKHVNYRYCTNTIDYPQHCRLVRSPISRTYKVYSDFTCTSSPNPILCKVHFE